MELDRIVAPGLEPRWRPCVLRRFVNSLCLPIGMLRPGKPNLKWFHYLMAWSCLLASLSARGLLILGCSWKEVRLAH
jgi:hypothetical protein